MTAQKSRLWLVLLLLQSAFLADVLSEKEEAAVGNNATEPTLFPTVLERNRTDSPIQRKISTNATEPTKKTEQVVTTAPVPTTKSPMRLANEPCIARPTLVNTDANQYKFFPLVISLYRCGGACGVFPPMIKHCAVNTEQKIPVMLFDRNKLKPELVHLSNHTSCKCKCTQDSSVCDPETQIFDHNHCQCKCKKDAKQHTCPPNYTWDSTSCRCVCEPFCNYRQDVNLTSCSCACRQKFYRRCNRKKKIIDEETCKCLKPPGSGRSTGEFGCNPLPQKWVALIAVISTFAILVIAFDAILLGKRMGFFHAIGSWFSKRFRRRTHQPVANSNT